MTRAERIEAAAVALLEVADEWAGTRRQLRELRAALSTPADASAPSVSRMGSTCAYLSDGTKITVRRDGNRAWLEHVPQDVIRPAEQGVGRAISVEEDFDLAPAEQEVCIGCGRPWPCEHATVRGHLVAAPPPRPDEDGGRCGDRNRLAEGPCILPQGHSDWHSDGLGSGWDDESTGRAPKEGK